MRIHLLSFSLIISIALNAQSSTWDVHPLNTIPCPEWIYPEPGCGGCGSCRMAIDSQPTVMDGSLLHWSDNLIMCPHPIDNEGHNAVVISNWPIEASNDSYLYGHIEFHEAVRIDTVEVIGATMIGGPDSLEVAVQFNSNDPLETTTVLKAQLTGTYAGYRVADLGCVPMPTNGPAIANIHVRAHGGDLGFIFRGIRVVASPCSTASISEMNEGSSVILPVSCGVQISTSKAVPVSVCDACGRLTYQARISGSAFIPLEDGVSVVRVGSVVRTIVR